MKLVIEQELAQRVLNVLAEVPYIKSYQVVYEMMNLKVLPEEAPVVTTEDATPEVVEVTAQT